MRVLASQVSGNAGYFVAVLILARALGPINRGAVAFITVTALVTSQLANLGVSDATRVMAARSPAQRPTLLANIVLAELGGATIVALCIALVLELVPGAAPAHIGSSELVVLVAGTIASASAAAGYAFLQGCGRFRPYSRVQATAPWFYAAGLGLTELAAGLTVARAAAIWSGVQGVTGIVLLSAAAAETGWTRPKLHALVDSVRFGARAWIGSLSRLLNARTDQIIIGIISTEATLGIYAVAVNASEVLYYLPGAVATALLPAVARTEAHNQVTRTLRVYRATVLLTMVALAVAAALGPLLLPIVFGEPYQDAVGPFEILVPSSIGFASMSVFSGASLGSLAPGRSSLGPLVALSSQTVLDLMLIPRAGASGAALAATVALFAGGAVSVCGYRARFPFAWRLLLPGLKDFYALGGLARRMLRPPGIAPS